MFWGMGGGGGGGAYSRLGAQNYFIGGGVGAYSRLALINFSYLKGGRLFEVGAYSRLGA